MGSRIKLVSIFILAAWMGTAPSLQASGVPAPWSPIGVAGAVRGAVRALPAGSSAPIGRLLHSGEPLYLNETISTGPNATLQVMLNDETVFTVGPRTVLVLDKFDFDAKSGSGHVVATVQRGLFRFVTGLIGHNNPSHMTVKFPSAVMSVRGTMVVGEVSDTGMTTAVLLGPGPSVNATEERVGAFSMTNAGVTVDVLKPGYATHVDGPNSAPSLPARLPQQRLEGILGGLAQAAHARSASAKPVAPDQSQAQAPTAPDQSQTQQSPGSDQSSAGDAAGQTTAVAAGDLSTTQGLSDLGTGLSNDTIAAANAIGNPDLANLIAANLSSWDDVRSITSGTGYYDGTDVFTLTQCGGGACANPSGNVSMHVDVDFGAQTIGSAASNVTVNANDANLSAPINDVVNFPARSFATLTGSAALSGASASGATQANISVLNFGGTAQSAVAIARYADTNGTVGSGAVGAMLTCTSGTCH